MTRTVNTELVSPVRFAHFVLRVSDMAQSVRWYTQVVGMEIVHQNDQLTFMTYDEEHHRLALAQTKYTGEVPKGAPGLDHVAYTIVDLGGLMSTYKRLKEIDIWPVWPVNHGLTTSLYYADPDGHRVEFQVENYPTKEELQNFMRSDAFAANPIGVKFDPEVLLARYENGDPIEELLQQGAA